MDLNTTTFVENGRYTNITMMMSALHGYDLIATMELYVRDYDSRITTAHRIIDYRSSLVNGLWLVLTPYMICAMNVVTLASHMVSEWCG
jgi:hypothetical protein